MGVLVVDSNLSGSEKMTVTPWGPAEELRSRKLSPGPGELRADVVRNQRERLMGATVAVVAKRGYETTRVADILALAGVSRGAFYEHFDNKLDCFLATIDGMIELAGPRVAAAYEKTRGPWDARLHAALEMILTSIVAQRAAARLWFIEAYAAGPEAMDRIEKLEDRLQRLTSAALAESPEHAGMPPQLVRAIVGGVRQIVHARLRDGTEAELPGMAPDIIAWVLSYRTPPEPLRRPRKPPALPPSSPDRDEQRERILTAVTELVTEEGYSGMTMVEVAGRAEISLSTFYKHFDNKQEVFAAAVADGERRLVEAALPAYRDAPDWPTAVKDGLHAFFAFLATNAATARLGGIEVYASGRESLKRYRASTQDFQALLLPGYQQHPRTSALAGEAVSSSILALLYQRLRHAGAERLYEAAPTAVFIALAPFVGSGQACALANEGWQPSAP